MCGIAGYYCWGTKRPPASLVPTLLVENEIRGRDATGFAYVSGADVAIEKAPMTATAFVKQFSEADWSAVAQSPWVLAHTRAATSGSPEDNENNHPVVAHGWVVVHNGHISNDDDIANYFKAERISRVDTETIAIALANAKGPSPYHGLTLLQGTVSAALWSGDRPDEIAVVRHGHNGVRIILAPEWDGLLFSSEDVGPTTPAYYIGGLGFSLHKQLPEGDLLVLKPGPFGTAESYRVVTRALTGVRAPRVVPGFTPTPASTGGISTHKWYNTNDKMPGRPTADFSRMRLLDPSTWELTAVIDAFDPVKACVVPTAYGQWIMRPTDEDFWFKPYKSMKKYMRRNKLPEWWAAPGSLQVLHGKAGWEVVVVREQQGTCSTTQILYVCPWCGAVSRRLSLDQNSGACAWCNIQSTRAPAVKGGDE